MSFVSTDVWSTNGYIASDQTWNQLCLISNQTPSNSTNPKPNNSTENFTIISSLSGVLHVFNQDQHILTKQMQQPILQMRAGRFVQAIKNDVLVILHPHQLEILYLEKLGAVDGSGGAQVNQEFQLVQVFQQNMSEACYSLHCFNHKIFVQSFYNTISLFERESLVFSKLLSEERIMLPSEITYCSNRDIIITASFSSRRVCAFKVSKIASFTDIQSQNSNIKAMEILGNRPIMDWQWMMPEAGGYLSLFTLPALQQILILTRNHITKLDENGRVLKMVRTNIRICTTVLSNKQENSGQVNTSLVLLDKRGKLQVMQVSDFKLVWNGQYKSDSGQKTAVSLEIEPETGKIFALEANGRVTANVLGSLKIHTNPQQKRLEQMEGGGTFSSLQDKLKLAYKAIQQNVKKDSNDVAEETRKGVENLTVAGKVSSKPDNVEIRYKFSDSFDGIKLTLSTNLSETGKFSIKLNQPLNANKISKNEFCINCSNKKTPKLSTLASQVVVSFMYSENLETPTLKTLKTLKLTIPGNLLFALLFEPVTPDEITNLPIKLTLAHSLDEIKTLPFTGASNLLEFNSKFGNEMYKLQIIPAKSGSKRTRIQVSHLSVVSLLLGDRLDFELEGHIPVENFAAAWKKSVKFQKKRELVEKELASITEVVGKLQQEVLRITKDGSTQQDTDELIEKAYQLLENSINDLNEGIDDHEKYTLFASMANEDVFASIWLFGYFTKDLKNKNSVLPNGGSFCDVNSWREFLQHVLFDEESSETELLDTGNILEKLHGYYTAKGFITRKKEKERKEGSKKRRSKAEKIKVDYAETKKDYQETFPEEPAQVFVSEKLLAEANQSNFEPVLKTATTISTVDFQRDNDPHNNDRPKPYHPFDDAENDLLSD